MHFLSYMDPCEGRDPVISSISGFPPEPHLRGAMVYPRVGGGGNDIFQQSHQIKRGQQNLPLAEKGSSMAMSNQKRSINPLVKDVWHIVRTAEGIYGLNLGLNQFIYYIFLYGKFGSNSWALHRAVFIYSVYLYSIFTSCAL